LAPPQWRVRRSAKYKGDGRPIFFFKDSPTTEIYTRFDTLSLHDALPIYLSAAAMNIPLASTQPSPLVAPPLINTGRGAQSAMSS